MYKRQVLKKDFEIPITIASKLVYSEIGNVFLTRLSSMFDDNCIKSIPVSCKIFNLDSEFDAKIIGKFDFNIDLVLLIN